MEISCLHQIKYNSTVIVREKLNQRYFNTGSNVSVVHISDVRCLASTDVLVSVRPELINPCKTLSRNDISVSLHNVNFANCRISKTEKIATFTSDLLCTFGR